MAEQGMTSKELARTIVVGVDGSDGSKRALAFAIDEAAAHDWRVMVVHGVDVGLSAADPYGGGAVLEQLQEAGRVVLDAAAAEVTTRGLEVTTRLEVGSPAYALVDAAKGAAMLVVGSRGHGGFVGLLLGSVSSACVHHAHCPIVVIPKD
jgi:nucleotide-binding universal stress UspA family protein